MPSYARSFVPIIQQVGQLISMIYLPTNLLLFVIHYFRLSVA